MVQPLVDSNFASLPEVREIQSESLESLDMLTHQSRSLPSGPPIPGARFNRTPSISSQGHIDSVVLKVRILSHLFIALCVCFHEIEFIGIPDSVSKQKRTSPIVLYSVNFSF